jgi:hypothetical protein
MHTKTLAWMVVITVGATLGGIACNKSEEKSCAPGATQPCYCGTSQGSQICLADGSGWGACDCGPGGGDGGGTQTDGGTPHDGTTPQLDGTPPQPDGGQPSPCNPDEVKQPNANLCWKKCYGDQTWDGAKCFGYAKFMAYPNAEAYCTAPHRFPTLDEVKAILSNCTEKYVDEELSYQCNSCDNSPICLQMFGAGAEGQFWTSSDCTSTFYTTPTKWRVGINYGIECFNYVANAHARCVRSLP